MEPADSYRYSLIVPEGGEQEQGWMLFAPLGDAFSLLLVVRRFHDLWSFHQRLLKVGPLRGPEITYESRISYLFNPLILKYFLKRRGKIWWFQEKSVTLHPEIVNRL